MLREGPHLCSPFVLQISKGAVHVRCRRTVQEWPSNNWTRHWFPQTGCRHPHPRGFPARGRHWVGKWVVMTLNLASWNVRGLRDPSRCARLLDELSNLRVDVAAVQENHFIYAADCRPLEDDFAVFSAFGSRCGAGVSLLVGHCLNANVNVVFAGDEGRLVVVKTFEFRVVAVYAPNTSGERRSFHRRLEPFLGGSKRLILMGDWNAILDPKVDKDGRGARRLERCESSLIDFLAEFDLIDRFRLDHPGREMWTCLRIPWFFSRGRTRLAFSFFLTQNFFLFPLGGDSRYFYLLFLARVFFLFFSGTVNTGRY